MKGVLELDIQGIKQKAGERAKSQSTESRQAGREGSSAASEAANLQQQESEEEELGSEYEEVEVTDDEGEGEDDPNTDGKEGHRSKRQRTEDPGEEDENHMPVEFNEDDIAYQLQAMGEEYGLEQGEYDDGDPDAWPEGAEGNPLTAEDARELFRDLLDDHGVNPWSPWEKLLEEGRVFDDPRYTALPTTKARREAWEEWSRDRIRELRERRAREERRDPRIPFLAFLAERAVSPKLYWPEFRRKYRKESAMRDPALSDRDRERLYRDHVARLRAPLDTRKRDLEALLRDIPLRQLNARTPPENLPPAVLADPRYYAGLDPTVRDDLVAAHIRTLPGPPEDDGADANRAEENEETRKKREERRKRERALEERERVVAEEKRRQRRLLEQGRAVLREEEREIESAMRVDKRGLQSQLEAAREREAEKEKEKAREAGREGDASGGGADTEMDTRE